MVLSPRVKFNSSDHQAGQFLSDHNSAKCYQTVYDVLFTTSTEKLTSHFFTSHFFFFLKKTPSRNIPVSFLWLPVLKYANSIKARDDLKSSQSVFSIISRCQFNLLLLLIVLSML